MRHIVQVAQTSEYCVIKAFQIQFFFFNLLDVSIFMLTRPIIEIETIDHYSVRATCFRYHLILKLLCKVDTSVSVGKDIL